MARSRQLTGGQQITFKQGQRNVRLDDLLKASTTANPLRPLTRRARGRHSSQPRRSRIRWTPSLEKAWRNCLPTGLMVLRAGLVDFAIRSSKYEFSHQTRISASVYSATRWSRLTGARKK